MKNINYDIKRTILFFSTAIAGSMATLIFLKNFDSNYPEFTNLNFNFPPININGFHFSLFLLVHVTINHA